MSSAAAAAPTTEKKEKKKGGRPVYPKVPYYQRLKHIKAARKERVEKKLKARHEKAEAPKKKSRRRYPEVFVKGGESVQRVQDERAFQKQPQIFQGFRGGPIKGLPRKYARSSTRTTRYWKNIGLGFKVPTTAQTGDYVDKKCPFTGGVSIRGRILRGKIVKMHMKRTVIIRRDYMHYVPKYKRYEKRHRHFPAHLSPAFRVHVGDVVDVGQCRPLSKTVRFNVINIVKAAEGGEGFKKF